MVEGHRYHLVRALDSWYKNVDVDTKFSPVCESMAKCRYLLSPNISYPGRFKLAKGGGNSHPPEFNYRIAVFE